MTDNQKGSLQEEILALEERIMQDNQKLADMRRKLSGAPVKNYDLHTSDGQKTTLKDLIQTNNELVLIHNMGPQCPYCTLWADGFNAFYPYFKTRSSFALEMNIPHGDLKKFAQDRGWNFPTVSSHETSLKKDLNFYGARWGEKEMNLPGVSTFYLKEGEIFRHSYAYFGPRDSYCSLWPILDLLKDGVGEWQPDYNK